MENNTYLLADPASRSAVVIDPSFESERVLEAAAARGWTLTAIWLTHAHFDHIAGISALTSKEGVFPPVGVHPADLPLYRQGGGSHLFGMRLPPGPEPSFAFAHGQTLALGSLPQAVEVRHAPGHTPGHVIFYLPAAQAAICGDVIFYRGIGRTDLPGGDYDTLIHSIRTQVFTLPPATRLLCGHGLETTVAGEQDHNPFL